MKKCLWTCGFHKVITNKYQHSKREKSHILDVHFRSLFFPLYPFFLNYYYHHNCYFYYHY